MNVKEFAQNVQIDIEKKMGEEVTVNLHEVRKNNNVILQGLMILKPGQNITPTIYLDSFFAMYEKGATFQSIIEKIIEIYKTGIPKTQVNMDFFNDFNKVKNRIAYKLINFSQNEELLNQIPHICFLDLAICFYYAYTSDNLGNGTILIYNTHMNMWKTNTKELLKLAQNNTLQLFGVEIKSMTDIIKELIHDKNYQVEFKDGEQDEFILAQPMQIISNQQRFYGASSILYPGLLQKIAESLNANLYILPSSVHELILLADTGKEEAWQLRTMVQEVNATQVEPEELLSDNVYYYNRILKKVEIIQ